MTDKRVAVPEGMLKAAMESREKAIGKVGGWSEEMCRPVLEAALLYQREHPPVPTNEQAAEILNKAFVYIAGSKNQFQWAAREWVRCMYDAPAEPELGKSARRVIDDMMGCTFTPKEADAIVDVLQENAHGWDARGLKERK